MKFPSVPLSGKPYRHRYRTQRAVSGKDGLALAIHRARSHTAGLWLPDMDVCGFARIRVSQNTYFIVSARGLERDKVAALDLGADDYIVKPLARRLLARIRTALRPQPAIDEHRTLGLQARPSRICPSTIKSISSPCAAKCSTLPEWNKTPRAFIRQRRKVLSKIL